MVDLSTRVEKFTLAQVRQELLALARRVEEVATSAKVRARSVRVDGAVSSTGDLSLEPDTGTVRVTHPTTGASANAVLDGTTRALARSTSSLRYKTDVEDLDLDLAALLAIRPRTWRDRGEVAADPDTTRRYVGAIAEELDELGGGLEQFVVYDDQGRPDAIAYDRLTVALIAAVRRLSDRVADLEDR